MATIALCRGALRRSVAPVTLGLSTGLFLANRQRPMRLDAAPATSRSLSPATERTVAASEEWLRPEIIKQLSGGSLAGFLTGLVVSVFSKTLVLLGGVAIVAIQVSYQIDSHALFKAAVVDRLAGGFSLGH
ncbi:hypothetical protein SLS53_007127 [Cytospora paraplurivora]|uniref:Uncharacterized protein n=1 Tax=Cytospora paraplurivora TaxID=2898453 RepID=A0AAN9YEF4_9PEZI